MSKSRGPLWIASASWEHATGPLRRPQGLFTLKGQGPEVERTRRLARVQSLGGQDPQPSRAFAHTAHPPAQRPLGGVVRPCALGAIGRPRGLQCLPCTARARERGGGSAVLGHSLHPRGASAQPSSRGGVGGSGESRLERPRRLTVFEVTHVSAAPAAAAAAATATSAARSRASVRRRQVGFGAQPRLVASRGGAGP